MPDPVNVQIKKVRTSARIPAPQSHGASGMDLSVCLEHDIVLNPLERTLVPTGIAVSIPEGYEAQIRPRSGLAIKHGITLVNTPGTIDSDYRGEVQLVVINLGSEPFVITDGMRLAQMVIAPYPRVDLVETAELDATLRGSGGFGHTGI